MALILTIAMAVTTLTALLLLARWGNVICTGPMPVSFFTFFAILFTSGLDVGLIMFPLVDFELYAREAEYGFANPLAIEFGFWGFLVWAFYFLTTFYFCIVEPKLQLFQIPAIKFTNNLVVIGTCAFTAFLFLLYLPDYIFGIGPVLRYGLVAAVILFAVLSSTDIKYVRILSVASTWLFFALIAAAWLWSGMGASGLLRTLAHIGDYFSNLHRFLTPISEYHQFYLYWWFAWSIMIGQFVARFVGGLKAWQLFAALLIVPSIPIAIWFSVLYFYFSGELQVGPILRFAMVVVGVIFVINSLDSLIRLYTTNLDVTPERHGRWRYILGNWLVLCALVILYQFTPLKIEWIGLIVVAIYATVYWNIVLRRHQLTGVAT
ncbi:MAG: BCCT family transporter [Gammaproteobacteria bacterium]|nr:BCCT family transporter [Gammaproteobacteria bacterium]MDH5303882.1 BCCT family transporter [Gammaproteobacteria bacterium]MDH5321485.1 BCCT family transporter [Gammaproteobacteria bacterium]